MLFADLVLTGGQVATIDGKNTIASAVATLGNKIVYVGNDAEALRYAGPRTRRIDLKGRTLMPGFVDAHIHSGVTGLSLNSMDTDCGPDHATCIEDIKNIIRRAAQKAPKGSLIRAFNYNHNYLAERRHPNRWDLDEVAPDHLVLLTHASFHFSVANSKALERAGVTDDFPDPRGGVFVRKDGKVTGVAIDNAHGHLYSVFPLTVEEMTQGLYTLDKALLENGVTSVHDAGQNLNFVTSLVDLGIREKLAVRYYILLFSLSYNMDFIEKYFDIGFKTGFGNEKVRLGPIKIMLDGSSICGTVAMKKPYAGDPNTSGILTLDQKELNALVLRGHERGYQIACHSIGDKAIEMIIDAYENAQKVCPRPDPRHRIEHCTFPEADQIKRLAANKIVVNTIPQCIYSSGDAYLRQYGDRMRYGYAQQAYIDAGVVSAFSSDAPIAPINPMLGLHSACTRITYAGVEAYREEEVPILQALRMYTYNGAYLSFEENIKGSLEVGKLADMAVLSRPILDIPLDEIRDVKVDMTVLDGKVLYER